MLKLSYAQYSEKLKLLCENTFENEIPDIISVEIIDSKNLSNLISDETNPDTSEINP